MYQALDIGNKANRVAALESFYSTGTDKQETQPDQSYNIN